MTGVTRAWRKVLPAAACLILAGCAEVEERVRVFQDWADDLGRTGKWRAVERGHENRVEAVSMEHAVGFVEGKASLGRVERQSLADFLARSQVRRGEQVALSAPRRPEGHHGPLTAARLQAVKAALGELGVSVAPAEAGPTGRASGERITVVVTRTLVIPPDCSQARPARGDRPTLVIGCADTAALGLMVADPLDLEQGRALGAADGEGSALAIQRYRKGEITPLLDVESTTGIVPK